MSFAIWVIIILAAVVLFLLYANNDKKDQISNINSRSEMEKQKFNNEINELKKAVSTGEITLKTTKQNNNAVTNELRAEIAKLAEESQEKYDTLQQRYFKLMRAYMVFRKKSEIEVIDEIEESINEDYEALGSDRIMRTQYISSAMADFYTLRIKDVENHLRWRHQLVRSDKIAEVRKTAEELVNRAKLNLYAYEMAFKQMMTDYPEIEYEAILSKYNLDRKFSLPENTHNNSEEVEKLNSTIVDLKRKVRELKYDNESLIKQNEKIEQQIDDFLRFKDIRWSLLYNSIEEYQKNYDSNLTAIPYMSRIISDIMTVDIDRLAWSLSWGNNQERKKKIASLNLIKKEKQEEIEKLKWAEYQLAYLLEIYPTLQDVIDAEFKELDISYSDITEYDPVVKFVKTDEWERLSESERNQLALDRYVESRQKSKWQIGRDYELYCGYCYEQKGYNVDYYGSYNGLEDLGRDLIIKQGDDIRIVQCKYWSQNKKIHENHIMQLYGSVIEYNLENNANATGILLTNTVLSDKAKEFAKVLGISFKEKMPMGNFPRIKCNIGIGEYGEKTKIYHLPFDQQYDSTKIDSKDEFMAMTVAEAESAGFRRAYKWFGGGL